MTLPRSEVISLFRVHVKTQTQLLDSHSLGIWPVLERQASKEETVTACLFLELGLAKLQAEGASGMLASQEDFEGFETEKMQTLQNVRRQYRKGNKIPRPLLPTLIDLNEFQTRSLNK